MSSPFEMFPIRKGTNSTHGADFEQEMITFFLVQCMSLNLKDFAICSNVDGLGAWDDVLLYTETQDDRKHLSFMQLKHKLNPKDKTELLSDKEFKKYVTDYDKIINNNKTYCEANKKINNNKSSETKSLISSFKVNKKHMRFLFYTNAESGNILKEVNKLYNSQNIKTTNTPDIKALATNPNVDIYQLPDKGKFEKQVYLYTDQITVLESQLKTVIKTKLEDFNVGRLSYDDFQSKLIETVNNWIEKGKILRKSDLEDMFYQLTISRFPIVPNTESVKLFWKTFVLTPVKDQHGFTLSKELMEMAEDFQVYFHGNQIPFNRFVEEDSTGKIIKAFTTQHFVNLITDGLRIGNELDIPKYYVERKSPRIFCEPSIFQETTDNFAILASSDAYEKYKAQEELQIMPDNLPIVHNSSKIKFTKKMHILKIFQDKHHYMRLEWLHSKTRNIKSISKHLCIQEHENKDLAEELRENFQKKILVLANPGMGKSMFLKRLHNTLSHKFWPMFVTLNDLDFTKIMNFQSLADCYRERLKTDLEKQIFDIYKTEGDIVTLFDGYDEVHQKYVNSLNHIISDVVALNINIVVSSRHSKKEELENLLQVHPNTLLPFNEDNKEEFLQNYFTVSHADHEHLAQTFAKQLLKCHTFSKRDEDLTGIPLQLYMLGESYVDEWKIFSKTQKFTDLKSFTIIDLYARFVRKILNRFVADKMQLEGNKLENLNDLLKVQFFTVHCNAALQLLFPELNKTVPKEELETTMQYGLIKSYNYKGDPDFVHRTFAEYLAADWLFKNKNDPPGEKLMQLLTKTENAVILDIFDRIVCKDCPLHLNVLDNDIESIEQKIEEWKNNKLTDTPLDSKQCGRSSLHLIACRGKDHIVHEYNRFGKENKTRLQLVEVLLANCKHWNNEPDEIHKKTPFEMAWNRNAFDIVNVFLKCKVVDSIPVENLKGVWENILFICAELNYDTLTEKIIQAFNLSADKIQNIRKGGNSLLHTAAERSSLDVLNTLRQHFPNLNVLNFDNETPLHLVCERANLATIAWFLDNGTDLSSDEFASFGVALKKGNKHVRKYITNYENLKKWFPNKSLDSLLLFNSNRLGWGNALHAASFANNVETIKQLVEIDGMNVNALSSEDYPSTFWAVEGNSEEALSYLLNNRVNVQHDADRNPCPKHKAATNIINLITTKHGTALDYAIFWGKNETKTLLEQMGGKTTIEIYRSDDVWYDLNDINKVLPGTFHEHSGGTALHWACALNDVELMASLLSHPGVNVRSTDDEDQTPIFWAIKCGSIDAIRMLLQNTPEAFDDKNFYGHNCINYAIKQQNMEVVKFLLNYDE